MKSLLAALSLSAALFITASAAKPPNIVFIMVDDAGVGDFSTYGGKHIKTPIMDKMAAEGMKFTNAYSSNAVCGPTRCSLMTGLHPGHAIRRANQSKNGLLPLSPTSQTVASMLKKAGYATGGFGKWGLGNVGTTGVPEKHGFDLWYGYYDQRHAHDYYPEYLVRNSQRVELPKNKNDNKGTYTHYLIEQETIKFIEDHKDQPFFCYAAWTPPHGKYVIPENDPNLAHYKDKPWNQQVKNYAAMVSLLDQGVGRIFAKLKELGIDDNTLVIYTSDNGANPPFIKAIQSSGGLRGAKRSLYEGGIRAPFIARWPGKIKPATTSDLLVCQTDLMEIAAEMNNLKAPKNDGASFLPTLLGNEQNDLTDRFLYFEIYEGKFQQCLRQGKWKAYRRGLKDPIELYDLSTDPAEKNNIAAKHPQVAKDLTETLTREHTPSKNYNTPDHFQAKKQPKIKKPRKNKK